MKAQRYHSLGLAVLSSALVLLSGSNVVAMSSSSAPSSGCTDAYLSDGDCDLNNNTEECGYDGGDCCECTCVDTTEYVCGVRSGFSCLDPSSACFDGEGNDDVAEPSTPSPITISTEAPPTAPPVQPPTAPPVQPPTAPATEEPITTAPPTLPATDPPVQPPTAPPTPAATAPPTEEEPSTSTSTGEDNVEAGTKTTVSASANAYDERPGAASGENGCQEDGCEPALTRDGVTADAAESRWSCAPKLVPGGLQCAIDFDFKDPQDIVDVEVAFFKGEERTRTVEIWTDTEVIGEFDSSMGSTFSTFSIQAAGVETLTIASVGLGSNDWLSFTEVRFMVKP